MKNKLIYTIIFLIFVNVVFATTIESNNKGFKVTYPDKINVFEPITLHFEISNRKLIKNKDLIYGDFSIPLTEGEGFEHHSDLPLDGYHYIYDGRKSFDIVISLLANGALDLNNKENYIEKKDNLETTREIYFHNDEEGTLDSVKILFKANPYNFDIKNVPADFSQKNKDLNTLTTSYSKKDDGMSNSLGISISSYNYNFHDEQKLLSKYEIMNEVHVPEGWTKETFTVNGNPAYLTTSCKINGWDKEDKYNGDCWFSGEIFMPIGRLSFNMRKNDRDKPKATIESEIDKWKSFAIDSIQNIIMTGGKSSGITIKSEKKDEGECESNSDCNEDKVCNACGECVKDAIDPTSVNIEIELKNKLSSKSIYNSVREQTMITTEIIPTFTYNNKKINYCDIAAPGIKKELVAEMKNSNPYAGFLLRGDLFNEERTKTQKTILDFSETPLEHHFLISPNDKKKIIGELGEVTENIEIKIEGLATSNEKLILKPVDLSMDIKSAGVQLQEDSNKLIKITPKDKYAKHIYFKASMAGPGELEIGEASFKQVYTKTKPGELIKLMYYAPEMGNFDIGKELASLSMVNLQKDAAKQIAEDAVLAYAGDAFQGTEDLHNAETAAKNSKAGINAIRGFLSRNPGKYNPTKVAEYVKKVSSAAQNSKKLDLAAKSFKLYSGTYGLTQIPKGTVSMRDDMKQVIDQGENKNINNRKTWTESMAEYGIVGIDVAQTGLSILTFIPSKIPGVKKINAGFKTAFSAMTNIWKANLLYIAKDEKIGRAEEHLYPIMILVTAEDESGWQLTQGYILQVAFHEI